MTAARGLFITGTGTGVGKTYVAALIARSLVDQGHRVGVCKPVASGCTRQGGQLIADDAVQLWEAAGRPETLEAVCPQRFAAPLAPHLAAEREGKQIDSQQLVAAVEFWQSRSDVVLVEGAGGLMSPLSDSMYNAELADALGYPLLVVAPNRLGVINDTLQTLIVASTFGEGLEMAGVVLCATASQEGDPSTESNLDELRARCVPPVLAHVGWGQREISPPVDWMQLASEPIDRPVSIAP